MSDATGPRRGGRQVIPQPESSRPGPTPFWVAMSEEARRIDLPRVRAALAAAAPVRHHERHDDPTARSSAVLIPLYEHDGVVHVVLTRRPWHLQFHPGEVSFPGGGRDPGDVDLRATALREAEEEIGLPPDSVEIIGELDHLATLSSNAIIAPFVGVIDGRRPFTPDPGEVEAVLEVPLPELLLEECFRHERWTRLGVEDRDIYFFDLVGDTIWGATGAMLHAFLRLVLSHDPGLVDRGLA